MISKEALEAYRQMTPGQRLELTFAATKQALEVMLEGPPDVVAKRFQRIRDENEARNRALRETIGAAESQCNDES